MASNNETIRINSCERRPDLMLLKNNSNVHILDDDQLNNNGTSRKPCTLHHRNEQELPNNFYTKRFEEMIKKNDISKNIEFLNYKNIIDENTSHSFDEKLVENEIPNIFPEKESQNVSLTSQLNQPNSVTDARAYYNSKTETSSVFNDQFKETPFKTLDTIQKVAEHTMGYNYLEENNVEDGFEYPSDSDEEYEIYKSGPIPETDPVRNSNDLESQLVEGTEILKTNINNSPLKNIETTSVEKIKDSHLLIRGLKNDSYLSNEILSMMSGKCLLSGTTQTEILTYLREKEIPGTIAKLKRDIAAFLSNAAQARIINKRNKRFYLNSLDVMGIRSNCQSLKRKADNQNDNFPECNRAKQNGHDNEGRESISGLDIQPSASKDIARMCDKESEETVLEKKTENESKVQAEETINDRREQISQRTKKMKKMVENPENDITMTTLLNMIAAAKSRGEAVKRHEAEV